MTASSSYRAMIAAVALVASLAVAAAGASSLSAGGDVPLAKDKTTTGVTWR